MKRKGLGSWMLAVMVVACLAAVVWAGRHQLDAWTRDRLAAQHARMLAELDERWAAALIAQLADDDPGSLALLVAALADTRQPVATAAEEALVGRLERWRAMRSTESSPRVAALAEALAQRAASLPEARREFAQYLAQRLIAWPVDRQTVNPGGVIADCETVLRLEPLEPPALRIAALESPAALEEQAVADADQSMADLQTADPLVETVPDLSPADDVRQPILAVQPDTLPEAGHESPVPPRRFLPPRGIGRVSD